MTIARSHLVDASVTRWYGGASDQFVRVLNRRLASLAKRLGERVLGDRTMLPLGNGLPGHPARNVIQNVTDKNARTAKSGQAVIHRRTGDDKPPQDFAHRGSPLSVRALSP
jgi:hypothetical protein